MTLEPAPPALIPPSLPPPPLGSQVQYRNAYNADQTVPAPSGAILAASSVLTVCCMRTPNQRWVQAASIRLFHRLFHMRIFCCMRTPNQRRVQAVLSNQRVALEGAYDVAEVCLALTFPSRSHPAVCRSSPKQRVW